MKSMPIFGNGEMTFMLLYWLISHVYAIHMYTKYIDYRLKLSVDLISAL